LVGLPFFPNPGIFAGDDWAVGLMGSSLYVAYTTCVGIALALGLAFALRRWSYLMVMIPLFVSFTFTNTIHCFIFLALMVLVVVQVPRRGPIPQLGLTVMMATLIMSVAVLLSVLLPERLSLEHYLVRGAGLLSGRKMDSYIRHVTELPGDLPVFLLGAGPANLGCAMVQEAAYLPTKYHGWSFEQNEWIERAGGSILSHTRTGFLSIWGDLGPVAFLLYWGAHLYAMVRVWRHIRCERYVDPYQRGVATAFIGVMVLYFAIAAMVDIIHMAFWGCLPWILAGAAWTPQQETSSVPVAATPVPSMVEAGEGAMARS
jgi:hypothetical protein